MHDLKPRSPSEDLAVWVTAPSDFWQPQHPTPLAAVPVQVAKRGRRRAWPSGGGAAVMLGHTFAMPTHPIHGALRRGLLIPAAREEVVRVRAAGRLRRVKVAMGFQLPPAALEAAQPAAPSGEPASGAGLLKTHLDLVDLAYRRDAEGQGLVYDLGDALARLGFHRLRGGGYHPATVKEHLKRLQALTERHIALEGAAGEPVWRFWLREPDEALRPVETPADWEAARRGGRLYARPGAWLQACELPSYRLPVGRKLLQLPMDGHGHQVERLTLLLAAELAAWERLEMRHEPRAVKRGVGALLSRAGIADRDLLRLETAAKGNGPKRLRAYLAGEGFADEGALALLREQAGFDVDIADEAGFWAAGRGWVDRFWDARLRLGVRGCEGAAASATEPSLWLPPTLEATVKRA